MPFQKETRIITDRDKNRSRTSFCNRAMTSIPGTSLVPGLTSGLLILGVLFFVYLLIEALFLWIAGEIVVGRRVTYGESIRIAFFGTIAVVGAVILLSPFGLTISLGAALILFLLIVKGAYHTGWLGAMGVSIVSIIVAVIIFVVAIAVLGLSLRGLTGL
jgi:hypothetical protein